MKRALLFLCCFLFAFFSLHALGFQFRTSAYAYNGENTLWNATRTTITYFENVTEGAFVFEEAEDGFYFRATFGGAVLTPFHLELPNGMRFFPLVRLALGNEYAAFRIGTLTHGHNLPAPMRDPLIDITPYVREDVLNTTIENGPETYRYGKFTHGHYEYGASFAWNAFGKGEAYMNWQLLHTEEHRERFDVGLMHAFPSFWAFTPYAAAHYWHNGGHEYPFVPGAPALTENYTAAAGAHNERFSLLYFASYHIPDRDMRPDSNAFGQALFLRARWYIFNWFELEPIVFASSFWLNANERYISVEGDPFYRAPAYFALNLRKALHVTRGLELEIALKNGAFVTEEKKIGVRYDFLIKLDYAFDC